jgi:sorbitol-specific phosphotransferase system component IIBC
MNALSLKTLLLVLAIILFIMSVVDDTGGGDWIAFGLAVLAAALLVSEAGWGRNIGGRRS